MDIKWSSSSHLTPSPNISGNPQLHKGFCRALRLRSSRRFQVFFPEVLHHSQEVLSGSVRSAISGFFLAFPRSCFGGSQYYNRNCKKKIIHRPEIFGRMWGVRCSSYSFIFGQGEQGEVVAKRNDTFLELSHVLSTFILHHYSEV